MANLIVPLSSTPRRDRVPHEREARAAAGAEPAGVDAGQPASSLARHPGRLGLAERSSRRSRRSRAGRCAPALAAAGAGSAGDRQDERLAARARRRRRRRPASSANGVRRAAGRSRRSTVPWPTPGTTSSWPWGKRETTDTAPAVGVRMSKPPLTASTGTFGSGPAPSVAPPDGLGQPRQKSALPKRAAHVPNGPERAGRQRGDRGLQDRRALGDRRLGRPRERAVAAHRRRVERRSSGRSTARRVAVVRGRRGGATAACCRAAPRGRRRQLGGDAGVEVGVEHVADSSIPSTRSTRLPVRLRAPCHERLRRQLVRDRGRRRRRSRRRRPAAAVRAERVSVAGIARRTSAPYGSGSSGGTTESSSIRSTWSGCASAYASASFVPYETPKSAILSTPSACRTASRSSACWAVL